MIDHLDQYVSVWKVGSGDINYRKQLHKLGQTRKPIMLATGANTMEEIEKAVNVCKQYTDRIVLMQCNTNYTGKDENFDHINLNVLKTFTKKFQMLFWALVIILLATKQFWELLRLGLE